MAVRCLLFQRHNVSPHIKKILISRVGTIGDTLCAIPALATIRNNYPNAEIVLITSPGHYGMFSAKDILEKSELIDKIIVYYQDDVRRISWLFNFVRNLREKKFDLFIELPQNRVSFIREVRNIFFAKCIACTYAVGFRIGTIKLFRRIQAKYGVFKNEVDRLRSLLEQDGFKIEKTSFSLVISSQDREIVSNFLSEIKKGKIIAINPNAKRQTNRWPLERFAAVGKWLINNYKITLLILGGEADKKRTNELKEMIGRGSVGVAGEFSILQTIELLRHCALLISNDTGTVHMAAVAGTPVLGIYSARDFANKWYPHMQHCIILRSEPRCAICFKENCETLACLNAIDVCDVKNAVMDLIPENFFA